jgi:hypothetical protein
MIFDALCDALVILGKVLVAAVLVILMVSGDPFGLIRNSVRKFWQRLNRS